MDACASGVGVTQTQLITSFQLQRVAQMTQTISWHAVVDVTSPREISFQKSSSMIAIQSVEFF
jgi:hypothetical protein